MSIGWPDAAFEADLRRLLRGARASSRKGPAALVTGDREVWARSSPDGFTLVESEDLVRLRGLQRRLAGSSRLSSGFSGEEAGALLTQTCEEAVAGTIKGAVASLRQTLAAPLEVVEVTEPVEMLLTVPRVVVGRVTFSSKPPRRPRPLSSMNEPRWRPPFASTRVGARGAESAQVLARRRFVESLAILDLLRPPANVGSEVTGLRWPDGTSSLRFHSAGPFLTESFVSGTRLVAPFCQLAVAAGRDESARTEWERRLLGATRWYSQSYRDVTPGDRLAGVMVALECLFIEGRKENYKGTLIAERLTDRFKLNEKSKPEQIDWLKSLYEARNDATHEGRDFVDDLDVERLFDLARAALRGLVWHLDPSHRSPHRACRTYTEAMKCSAP